MNPGVPEAFRRFDLSGRIALVTGASSGLGEGLARGLASAGARVAVVARYDRLVKLADEIGGMAIGCDLLDLAVQWARYGIRVNTVAPGFFRSEITHGMYDDERSLAWLQRNTPLPCTGTVEDWSGRSCGWSVTPGDT